MMEGGVKSKFTLKCLKGRSGDRFRPLDLTSFRLYLMDFEISGGFFYLPWSSVFPDSTGCERCSWPPMKYTHVCCAIIYWIDKCVKLCIVHFYTCREFSEFAVVSNTLFTTVKVGALKTSWIIIFLHIFSRTWCTPWLKRVTWWTSTALTLG